jgi:hypothetical protein
VRLIRLVDLPYGVREEESCDVAFTWQLPDNAYVNLTALAVSLRGRVIRNDCDFEVRLGVGAAQPAIS